MLAHLKSIIERTQGQEPNSNLILVCIFIFFELGDEPNLGSSTTVVVSKRTQRNLLLTLSSSKRMGNSCGCTEQMFYKYFLGPPHVEGAILMVSNYLSCFVTLWLIGLILWARTYHKKSYNEKDIRENGKSGKKSKVSC